MFFIFIRKAWSMTVILGVVSVLQAIFLPGYLITGFFYSLNGLSRLLVSFGLSLLFNYQLVFILTVTGLYGRPSVFILLGLECVVWFWLWKRDPVFGNSNREESGRWQLSHVRITESRRSGFRAVFGALSMIAAYAVVMKILSENPGIFNSWDDVVSWNRWATEWYAGHLPVRTYHYPQLIPANWSMMYHFIGTPDIEFFAKSIMGLFAAAILLIFYDLYKRTDSDTYLSACAWSGLLLFAIIGGYIGTGYMDIPSTFFCFSVFYVLLLIVTGYLPVFPGLILGSALMAACILVKQPGLFMLIPFTAACIVVLSKTNKPGVNRKTLLIVMATAYLLLAGPWFLNKELQIRHGTDQSEVTYVTKNIYAGKSKTQRFRDASVNFRDAVTSLVLVKNLPHRLQTVVQFVFFAVLCLLSLLSLRMPLGRFLMFFVVAPYYLIWALYFSYDLRNVSLLAPFWGLSLGIGSVVAVNWLAALPRTSGQWTVLSIAMLIVIVCSVKWPTQRLSTVERRMATEQLMDSAMNRLLYRLDDSGRLKGKVLCAYPMMSYLPGLGQFVEPFSFDDENLGKLKAALENEPATYKYCILPDGASPAVWEYFKRLDSLGDIKSKTRTTPGWNLIELNLTRK